MHSSRPPDVEHLLTLVSPRTGVVRNLSRVYRSAEEPPGVVIYKAQLSNFDFRRAPAIERMGAGKGTSENEAIAGAIGEAVERYCASHPDSTNMLRTSFAALAPHALDPTACVLYRDEQYNRDDFPYHRFDENAPMAWVRAQVLGDVRELFVPAAFVYLNYTCEPQEYLCPMTSNGLAAGVDLDAATLGGLCELIERDAFLITWMNRLPVSRIELDPMEGLVATICAHYRRFGIEMHAFNITTDIQVPVMMAIAVDRSGHGPAAVVGLGCHLNPLLALQKAILEVCQVRPGEAAKYHQHPAHGRLRSYEDIHTLEDHSAFFTLPSTLGELGFLLEASQLQHVEEIANQSRNNPSADLATCVSLLGRAGCQAVRVDVTTPDIAVFGLRVVRVIATELQPIHFGYGEERFGGHRLYEVPERLGYATMPRTPTNLNRCPHPLA